MLFVILANGDLVDTEGLQDLLDRCDFILAVDGGAGHCRTLAITPDALVGDLDSMDPGLLRPFEERGIAVYRHPARKDATDLELALDLAQAKGAKEVWLLGGLGGRWDMSLANVLLLGAQKYRGITFTLPGPGCVMHVLHPGEVLSVKGTPGERISLIPLHGDVHGLTLQGLEYPLRHATLLSASTQGVSNVMTASVASIQFERGALLCVRLTGP